MVLLRYQMIDQLERAGKRVKNINKLSKREIYNIYKVVFNLTPDDENMFEFENTRMEKIKIILKLYEKTYNVKVFWKPHYVCDKEDLLKIVKERNIKFFELEKPEIYNMFNLQMRPPPPTV